MGHAVWVFGYGSLVSPTSIERTIRRPVLRHEGFAPAQLAGYGRRWNYGSLRQRGDWDGPAGRVVGGIVVSLGLEAADEHCNGSVVRVTLHELELLDARESDYDRTDVTDLVDVELDGFAAQVVTYVPRPSAVERYLTARDAGRAAIRAGYVELVEEAFVALGGDHVDRYRRSTPAADVPILDFT